MQIFRSIDSDSAEGFPASNAEAAHLGLDSNKGRVVEFSIQKAYINAIRQARPLHLVLALITHTDSGHRSSHTCIGDAGCRI
jgi:hypothetical protein